MGSLQKRTEQVLLKMQKYACTSNMIHGWVLVATMYRLMNEFIEQDKFVDKNKPVINRLKEAGLATGPNLEVGLEIFIKAC